MKFCTHCGVEQFKTSRFCHECGAPHPYEDEKKPKRRRKVEEEAAPAIEEVDEDEEEEDTYEGIGFGWFFLVGFLLLIVILGSCSR